MGFAVEKLVIAGIFVTLLNSFHGENRKMEARKDAVANAAQNSTQGSSISTPMGSRMVEFNMPGSVKPVLNYSIQTGEEFALEFMRDRAISKKQLVPGTSGDQSVPTYMDLRGILGPSHTGSESGSDVSVLMTADNQRSKEIERMSFAEVKNRKHHTSIRSAPRGSIGDGSSRGSYHGYSSSEASDSSSKRIKFLCSFGGKILPRPSDGKLRYVGGETHIFRINRDISWQELKQKTTAIYNQPHSIKYQLPGEDLDALISVSSDEDLRNMMEECTMLEGGQGSQKLRIFLFSSLEFDDMNFSLGSMDGDSEIQFVVAVNGMDVGTGRASSGHGLASTSVSELDQFINLNVDTNQANMGRERTDLHGINSTPFKPPGAISTHAPASLSRDYESNIHSYQGHGVGVQYGGASDYSYAVSSDKSYDIASRASIPSDYGYTSPYAPSTGPASAPSFIQQSFHDNTMEGSTKNAKPIVENVSKQKNEVNYFQTLENLNAPNPIQHHDSSFSMHMHADLPSVASAQEGSTSLLLPSDSAKHLEATASKATSVTQGSEFNEDDRYSSGGAFASGHSEFETDMTDYSQRNAPPQPARVFHSERIPREQADFLNRLSKSDDSLGSQFFMLQSQSVATESIAEAIDPVFEGNERASLAVQPSNLSNTAIDDNGLMQFDTYKELADAVPQTSQFGTTYPPEGSDPKETSGHHVYNGQHDPIMSTATSGNDNRILHDSSSTASEKIVIAGEKLMVKGKFKEPTIDTAESSKLQGNDATVPVGVSREGTRATSSSDINVPRDESSAPNAQSQDISVDINDRYSADLLNVIFSQAKAAQASDASPYLKDDAALSLNMRNDQPQSWSFFRNFIDQGEFSRKDISLIDQDPTKISEGAPRIYQYSGIEKNVVGTTHMGPEIDFDVEMQQEASTVNVDNSSILHPGYVSSQVEHQNLMEKNGEGFQVDNPFSNMGENLRAPVSEFEEPKYEESRTFGPVMDAWLRNIEFEHLQIIKNEDLEELRELGSGTFGTVYHGKWRGTDVAIKRLKKSCFTGRSSEQERLTVEFWREADILSKLHHPNVVAFYGVVIDGPGGNLATVTEYMVNGSLRHVLQRKDKYLDRRKQLIIAMDAAFGMEYLHSKNLVHFDLKCDNLLVNLKDQTRPICKVGDFGLSKIKRNTLVSGGVRGTLPWMAPELLHGGSTKVSEKVDVFSFGIVMWEILTGEEPYANMHYGAIIGGIVTNTLRPPVPANCDPDWRKLMEQCWSPDPMQRPAFTEIAGRLRTMASQVKTAK